MSRPLVSPRRPSILLGQLYQHLNKDGRPYLVGKLNGAAKILAIATDQELRGEIVWNLYLGEAYPLEQAAALAREIEEEPHG